MSSTLITHVYVVYVADGLKEIVPVKRVKNFSVKNKEVFKDPGALAYDVEWRDPEDNESYLYDALVHYVGTSEQDVQRQVDEGIANNRRLRKPTAKMLQAAFKIYVNESVSFTHEEWDMLEVTKKDTMLPKVAAKYIWKNDLKTKCFDSNKARSRAMDAPRTVCEERKLEAIYDLVNHRLRQRGKILHRDRIIKFCKTQLTCLFNDVNRERLSAPQVAELKRFRDEHRECPE